jgi:hypothetical protein
MKLLVYLKKMFTKRKSDNNFFSDAVSEGIKDTFREMGYRFEDAKKL